MKSKHFLMYIYTFQTQTNKIGETENFYFNFICDLSSTKFAI